MTLDELRDEWEVDSVIDTANLGASTLGLVKILSKYLRYYYDERVVMRKLDTRLKKLRHVKQDFIMNGPNEVTQKMGWKLPPKGKIENKAELQSYLDIDPDMIAASEELALQVDKVEQIKAWTEVIKAMHYKVSQVLDEMKFKAGVN